MGFNRSSSPENYSTPKLSLSKLPRKLRTTPVMATPPLNRLASIPFDWEEVPGKLRPDLLPSSTTESTTSSFPALHDHNHKNRPPVVRCLELPPRLLNNSNNAKVVNALSPTTVLDGPYNNNSNSNNYYEIGSFLSRQGQGQRRLRSFSSLPKGSFRNLLTDHKKKGSEEDEEEDGGSIGGGGMSNRYYCDNVISGRENQRVFKLSSSSSWRWGSFKDNNNAATAAVARGDMSPSFSSKNRRGDNNNSSSSKFSRVKRKSSFFRFSRSRSNFLVILFFL